MRKKAHHREDFAELAWKITSDRTTWTMRAWVLAELLKRNGIDADFILRASKEELVKLLEVKRGTS